MPAGKETFVAADDRPDVKLEPDMPITDLRVRDLQAILGSGIAKPIVIDTKPFHYEKHVWQEKFKLEKFEKIEKIEHKEPIFEVPHKYVFEPPPDPRLGDDPRIRETLGQLVESVSQLSAQMGDIGKRLAAVEKRSG